jgi:hypothetical protein
MGYLICDKCGEYYQLQEGESPEDFNLTCECGGELVYSESIDIPKIAIPFWKAIIIVLLSIASIILLMLIYNAGIISKNPAYLSVGLSFQLLLAIPIGAVLGYGLPHFIKSNWNSGYKYTETRIGKTFILSKVISPLIIGFIFIIIIIGDQLVHLGRISPDMTPFINIVIEISVIFLVIGVIAGVYTFKTKYVTIS